MPLEGTPAVVAPSTDIDCEVQNMITAKQTIVDGCAVLPKMQCHEVQMGQDARLLWHMKNQQGEAVNLTDCIAGCASQSSASSANSQANDMFDAISTPGCGIQLRMRELSGCNPQLDQVHCIDVDVMDSGTGFVRAKSLPEEITRHAGVYIEEWGVFTADNRMLFSNQCCTFIRRGLFGLSSNMSERNLGPPTLEEIRLSMRDNSPADNLLLDDLEFDAAEISQAVMRPIQYWNEIPPPIRPAQTTKTFPFREMWLLGIQAYLFDIAASHYRRNQMAYNAGGIAIDDKNKEQAYAGMSSRLMQQFQGMVQAKKIEINISLFAGSVGSSYGSLFY